VIGDAGQQFERWSAGLLETAREVWWVVDGDNGVTGAL